MEIHKNMNPDVQELTHFFSLVFAPTSLGKEEAQSLQEWINIAALVEYAKAFGKILEIRTENNLVGSACIAQQNPITWPDGNKAELFVIGIHPDYRGSGFGSKLLKECEKAAREFGAKKVLLNTHVLLTDSIAFYRKNSYIEAGILHDYYANGDAIFFTKDLA